MAKSTLIFGFVLMLAGTGYGYPTGAPEAACDDMIPRHGVDERPGDMPYTITPSQNEVHINEEVKLVISGADDFMGFLVEVRKGDKAVGSFQVASSDPDVGTINCHNNPASAATHKHPGPKNNVSLTWKAPSEPGTYKIYATIAQTGKIFWARREAGQITVVP